jgi:sugar transferase EpsL
MIKRLFDVFVSGAALLTLTPVVGAIAIAIAFRLGRPVFFRQKRPGLDGIPFELIKFRKMTNNTDEKGNLWSDEKRPNSLGRIRRAASLGELPGLWCVLKG